MEQERKYFVVNYENPHYENIPSLSGPILRSIIQTTLLSHEYDDQEQTLKEICSQLGLPDKSHILSVEIYRDEKEIAELKKILTQEIEYKKKVEEARKQADEFEKLSPEQITERSLALNELARLGQKFDQAVNEETNGEM